MKLQVVIEGTEESVNKFAGEIIRNSPADIEVHFAEIEVLEADKPQHEHLKEQDDE